MSFNTKPSEVHSPIYLKIRSVVRKHFAFLIPTWTLFKRVYWFARHPTAKSRFEKIYRTNYWASDESYSGCGSNLEATKLLRDGLGEFISGKRVQSMLDIPCGDFNWMQHMKLDLAYIGADIVDELVHKNQKAHGGDKLSFKALDLTKSPLPKSDLVFSRDCLNHLSFSDIKKATRNIKESQSIYLAVTQFPEHSGNQNQESGFIFRKINFRLPPFNWPEPVAEYPEILSGLKTLTVWKVSDLPRS